MAEKSKKPAKKGARGIVLKRVKNKPAKKKVKTASFGAARKAPTGTKKAAKKKT